MTGVRPKQEGEDHVLDATGLYITASTPEHCCAGTALAAESVFRHSRELIIHHYTSSYLNQACCRSQHDLKETTRREPPEWRQTRSRLKIPQPNADSPAV